jgi:hypothetical protein
MQLSSFTQYYIRKLLRQYLKKIKYQVVERASVYHYLTTDLDAVLQQAGLTVDEIATTMTQIETLVGMHHQLVVQKQHTSPGLVQIEEKLFELIGLRLQSFVPPSRWVQIQEDKVSCFKFFWAGEMRDGIRYQNTLYGLILESKFKYDLQLYQLISALSKADIATVLTQSPHRYAVWIDLQSSAYPIFIKPNLDLLEKVAKLHRTLYRFREAKVPPASLSSGADAANH